MVAAFTDSSMSRDALTANERSRIARNFLVLCGIAAIGETLSSLG